MISVGLNPLTETQSHLWQLRDKGLNLSQIGRMVGVSRQSVSKTLIQADRVVKQTLMDAAKSYKITLYRVNHEKGVAYGFSKALNSPIFLTYSPERGINGWYESSESCVGCDSQTECRRTILAEAARLGVSRDDLIKDKPGTQHSPAELAEGLFKIVFPKRFRS